jgi:hypothetical protein
MVSAFTAAAITLWVRLIYVERPAIDVLAIESVDSPISFSIIAHFNESEASCLWRGLTISMT